MRRLVLNRFFFSPSGRVCEEILQKMGAFEAAFHSLSKWRRAFLLLAMIAAGERRTASVLATMAVRAGGSVLQGGPSLGI